MMWIHCILNQLIPMECYELFILLKTKITFCSYEFFFTVCSSE